MSAPKRLFGFDPFTKLWSNPNKRPGALIRKVVKTLIMFYNAKIVFYEQNRPKANVIQWQRNCVKRYTETLRFLLWWTEVRIEKLLFVHQLSKFTASSVSFWKLTLISTPKRLFGRRLYEKTLYNDHVFWIPPSGEWKNCSLKACSWAEKQFHFLVESSGLRARYFVITSNYLLDYLIFIQFIWSLFGINDCVVIYLCTL